MRHVLRLPQHAVHEPGGRLRSALVVAGPPQGQDHQGSDGGLGAYAGDHVELSDNGDDFASTIGIGAVVSTKFTWPGDRKHNKERNNKLTLNAQKEGAMAPMDCALQREAASARALSGRALRYRLRQTRSARHHERRAALLRVLRRSLGRAGGAARDSTRGATRSRTTGRVRRSEPPRPPTIGCRCRSGVSSCSRPRRSRRHDRVACRGAARSRTAAVAALCLRDNCAVGRLGRVHRHVGAARLSRNAGLLRVVAHHDSAGALCAGARRLAARSRSAVGGQWR